MTQGPVTGAVYGETRDDSQGDDLDLGFMNLGLGRRRERRMQISLAGSRSEAPSAGASRLLACPAVFLSLVQEPRHCLSVGSVLPGEQKLPWVLEGGPGC